MHCRILIIVFSGFSFNIINVVMINYVYVAYKKG